MRRFLVPMLVLGLLSAAGSALAQQPPQPSFQCAGSLSVPVTIELSGPADVRPGQVAYVDVTVIAQTDLSSGQLTVNGSGPVELLSPGQVLPPLAAGEGITLSIPVRYSDLGRAAVQFQVQATNADGNLTFERTEGFYAILRRDKSLTGTGAFVNLELAEVESELKSGFLTLEEATAKAKEVTRPPVTTDQVHRPNQFNMPKPAVLLEAEAPVGELMSQSAPTAPNGNITVQGNVSWLDENGVQHPAFGMTVQVRDDELIGSELVTQATTDQNGDYFFVVDNDDGVLQGDRDIFVRIRTSNAQVAIETAGILGNPYEVDSGVQDEVPDNTVITENFVCANTGTGPACGLLTAASYSAVYASILNGGPFLAKLVLEWPGSTGSANYDGSDINLRPGDQWDWDVLFHEYGHYVQDVYNIENNPGGPHNIGDCVSDVQNSKSKGVRLAWAEGWATYFGTTAQFELNMAALGVPRVGDNVYADTGESNFSYSLESQNNTGIGEDNEIAVQRIFWDLYDSASDGRDNVSDSHLTLFNLINAADPTTLSGGWAALRASLNNAEDMAYGAISTDHLVGPSLNSPTAGTIVSPSNANFSWNRGVGCSGTYDGDSFSVRFYNANTNALVLTVPVGNTLSLNLTVPQLQTLIASSHDILWGVEGSNGDAPATGPYLGETFAITVNQPPVAEAGPDQTVECTSYTTTAVLLDGTGSSDPDGDALTYAWTATGITFNNAASATPTGQFPMGTTVVTLTVSDGLEEDTDTVSITIEDTTPPVITCPDDITVECSAIGGTPADDPQLIPFFAGDSAVDICDPNPVLSDDAPGFFPMGETVVTFTATDASGNASECTATVTVEDTTPPEITVELNRDVLWPPNHKMSDIEATVEVVDICDPNPTFVLTSITSDEPDDDIADGHTFGDIQDADLGTDDVEFQLRAERQGTENGRKYTIIYTASDMSGNTAPDTVCVRVPHDQSGTAMASIGFTADGMGIEPGASTIDMIVFTVPGADAMTIPTEHAYVGNHIGVVAPMRFYYQDVNRDREPDLVLTYDAAEVSALKSESKKKYPLAIHYVAAGTDYRVSNIFGLGEPMLQIDEVVRDERVVDPEIDPEDFTGGFDGDAPVAAEAPVETPAGPGVLQMAQAGFVSAEVFNVLGRKIRTLANTDMPAGTHDLRWDGADQNGRRVPNGIYFYRIYAPGIRQVQKVYLAR